MHRLQHRLVVANIRFVKRFAVLIVSNHLVQRRFNLRQIAGGRALCCPTGNSRLYQVSHFAHCTDKPWVIVVFQHPLQYVSVEVIPLVTRSHKRPAITFHFNQPLRHQRTKYLTDDVARGCKLLTEFCLSRKRRAWHVFAVNDLFTQRNNDAIGFIESHGESLCSVCSSLLYPDRCITRQFCSTSVMTFAFAVRIM
ncbi:Uncharacterised protein [Klebsiella pneumoniae]|nr:Uncharacterised protein [Klebsiella pneumoniae]